MSERSLSRLLGEVRACRLCAEDLPLGPRPVVRASATARILICGQAPGTRVHETGLPFNDPSGDRLRDWLGLDRDQFYDERNIALVPMGFCYPGRDAHGGDLPPRPECEPKWRAQILAELKAVELTLLVGGYAQRWHLGKEARGSLTGLVRRWRDFTPAMLPLPHPSWRNTGWIKRNTWFEGEVLPYLRRRVKQVLDAA